MNLIKEIAKTSCNFLVQISEYSLAHKIFPRKKIQKYVNHCNSDQCKWYKSLLVVNLLLYFIFMITTETVLKGMCEIGLDFCERQYNYVEKGD